MSITISSGIKPKHNPDNALKRPHIIFSITVASLVTPMIVLAFLQPEAKSATANAAVIIPALPIAAPILNDAFAAFLDIFLVKVGINFFVIPSAAFSAPSLANLSAASFDPLEINPSLKALRIWLLLKRLFIPDLTQFINVLKMPFEACSAPSLTNASAPSLTTCFVAFFVAPLTVSLAAVSTNSSEPSLASF